MLLSSGADLLIVSFLATRGILMALLAPFIVGALLVAVALYQFLVDYLKVAIFRRFAIA